jgi:hypothetical protein
MKYKSVIATRFGGPEVFQVIELVSFGEPASLPALFWGIWFCKRQNGWRLFHKHGMV